MSKPRSSIETYFMRNEDSIMKGILAVFGSCVLGMGLYYNPTVQKTTKEWKDNVERGYTTAINHVEKAAQGYAMRR